MNYIARLILNGSLRSSSRLIPIFAFICFLGTAISGLAMTVVSYEFSDWEFSATQTNEHVTATEYDFYSSVSPTVKGINGLSENGNPAPGFYGQSEFNFPTYMYFALTMEDGYELQVNEVSFDSRRAHEDSPSSYNVFYSTNGTDFTSIGSGTLSGTSFESITVDNGGEPLPDLSGTIDFRIYGSDASSRTNWFQDNIQVDGSVVPEPLSAFLFMLSIGAIVLFRKAGGSSC